MNNSNMINPNPQLQQPNYNPYQTLPFVLVQDMAMANSYNIGPGASVIFINQDMSEIRIKAKDASGFSMPDRTWSLTETTPKPAAAITAPSPMVTPFNIMDFVPIQT